MRHVACTSLNRKQATVAQQFQIFSGAVTPEPEEQPQKKDPAISSPADMEVVGQCPGDKRKIDQNAHTPPGSNAGDIAGDELPAAVQSAEPPIESDVQAQATSGATVQVKQPSPSPKRPSSFSSHEAMRKQLMEQNERNRKARSVIAERLVPY